LIDEKFIEKLRLTADHYKEGLGEEEYQEILERISKLEQRINN